MKYESVFKFQTIQKKELTNPDLRFVLDSYLRELDFLKTEKGLLEKGIKENFLPNVDVLQSVPGVGPVTSAVLGRKSLKRNSFHPPISLAAF